MLLTIIISNVQLRLPIEIFFKVFHFNSCFNSATIFHIPFLTYLFIDGITIEGCQCKQTDGIHSNQARLQAQDIVVMHHTCKFVKAQQEHHQLHSDAAIQVDCGIRRASINAARKLTLAHTHSYTHLSPFCVRADDDMTLA